MAALLTVDSGNMDKVTDALEECRRLETPVLKPDVSSSGVDFGVSGEGIRFGLTSVKGVGRLAAESVVAAQREGGRFKSIFDLAARVDTRVANKMTLEALIRAGACDDLGGHRAQLVLALDSALRAAATEQADRRAGQMSLLGEAVQEAAPVARLPDAEPWSESEQLRHERDTTGRYWSSHPLAAHEDLVSTFASHTTRTARECQDGLDVVLGGLLVGLQERVIRSGRNEGKRMARFRIEDFGGTLEAVMFSEAFQRYRELLQDNEVLFFAGDVDASREEITIRVHAVYPPADAPRELAGLVQVELPDTVPVDDLKRVLAESRGTRPVLLTLRPERDLRLIVRTDDAYNVDATPDLIAGLRELVGDRGVRVHPATPGSLREKKRRRRWSAGNGE